MESSSSYNSSFLTFYRTTVPVCFIATVRSNTFVLARAVGALTYAASQENLIAELCNRVRDSELHNASVRQTVQT
jgi:hypothetical protein